MLYKPNYAVLKKETRLLTEFNKVFYNRTIFQIDLQHISKIGFVAIHEITGQSQSSNSISTVELPVAWFESVLDCREVFDAL